MAAVVLGAAVLVKQLATSADDGRANTAQHRVDAVVEPKQVEKALASEPKAASPQTTTEPAAHLPPPTEAKPADPLLAPASSTNRGTQAQRIETAPAAPLLPQRVDAVVPPPARMNVEASTKESITGLGAAPVHPAEVSSASASTNDRVAVPRAGVSAAPVVAGNAATPVAPRPAAPAAPPRPSAAGAPATNPAASNPGSTSSGVVAPTPRAPRPFDESLATQQFEAAVAKAATCGQAGPTRGSGRVKVAIEPWGRVGRVTHLNQDFVGTQVGLCVMEAFQQMKMPPFDGNARAIAGDFTIQ
jgi:hypothetical protein